MACGRQSVHVRWRPPLSVAIVTQFVTRSLANVLRCRLSRTTAFFGHKDWKRHCSMNGCLPKVLKEVREPGAAGRYGLVMTGSEYSRITFAVSDYAQIGSLQEWLSATPGVQVLRTPSSPSPGELGMLDVLTVVAGSSGLVAAIKVIPEFLRSRRSGLSITATVKGDKFTITASNAKDAMEALERMLND